MADPHSFGSWLRQQRHQIQLTQAALGELVGCATITIKKIESEERKPSVQMALRLAESLQVPKYDWDALVQAARRGQVPTTSTKMLHHPALPAPRNAFFGREVEQARLAALLGQPDTRLVTLVGPPGVGKTRLALQVAWALQTTFEEGLYWVDLTPLTDAADIPVTICRVAGLPESTADLQEQLTNWLQSRTVLFILDNCEQLNAPEQVIAQLLDDNPRLSLLLTSRIPLDVYGEVLFPVAPLPTGTVPEDISDLADKPALALFQGRAREVQPEFSLTEENIQAVSLVCQELDGLPLAIELAARQLRHSTLGEIIRRIDQRLELLKQGSLDWQPRHQTFRAAIEWSVALLSEHEQRDFARLGVFTGGFTREGARALVSENSFRSLLQASLVQRSGDDRYSLLQTVREFALDMLAERGDEEQAYQAHARFFCDLAIQASAHHNSASVAEWQQRLAVEQSNVQGALAWCLKNDAQLGLELAAGMWRLWYHWGQYHSGVAWLRRFTRLVTNPTRTRARALRGMGVLLMRFGKYAELEALFSESLEIARQCQDDYQFGAALMGLGDYSNGIGEFERAGTYYDQALRIFEAAEDSLQISWALGGVAEIAYYHDHDLAKARSLMDRCVHFARLAESPRHLGWMLGISADMETIAGERERAALLLSEAQEHFERVGDDPGKAYTLLRQGALRLHGGQQQEAMVKLESARHLGRQTNTISYEAQAICLLGILSILKKDYEPGLQRCAAAAHKFKFLRQRLLPADVALLDKVLAEAQKTLGIEHFRRLYAVGGADKGE